MCLISTIFCPNKFCEAVQHRWKPCVYFCMAHYDAIRAAYDHHGPGPDGEVTYLQMRKGDCVPSCAKLVSEAQERPCLDHANIFLKFAAKRNWGNYKILPPFRSQARQGLIIASLKVRRAKDCDACFAIEEKHEDYLVFSAAGLLTFLDKYESGYDEDVELNVFQYTHYMPGCAEFPHNLKGLHGPERAKNIQSYIEDYAWMGAGRDEVVTWKLHKFNQAEAKKVKPWHRKAKPSPVSGKFVGRNVMLGSKRVKPSKTIRAKSRMVIE